MATKKSLGLSFVHLMAHSLFQVTAVLANNAWHRNVVLITPSELPAATGTKSTSLCQGSTAAPSARLESLPSDPLFPSPGAMDWAGLEGKSRITSFQAPCNGQGYPGSFAVLLQLQFSKLGRILVTWRLNVTTANLQKKESWGGHLQSWAYRAPHLHISQQYSLQVFPPSPLGIKKSLCIPLDPSTFNAQWGIWVEYILPWFLWILNLLGFIWHAAVIIISSAYPKIPLLTPTFQPLCCAKFILALCHQDVLLAKRTLYKWVSVVPFSLSEFSLISWMGICGSVDPVSVISVSL